MGITSSKFSIAITTASSQPPSYVTWWHPLVKSWQMMRSTRWSEKPIKTVMEKLIVTWWQLAPVGSSADRVYRQRVCSAYDAKVGCCWFFAQTILLGVDWASVSLEWISEVEFEWICAWRNENLIMVQTCPKSTQDGLDVLYDYTSLPKFDLMRTIT